MLIATQLHASNSWVVAGILLSYSVQNVMQLLSEGTDCMHSYLFFFQHSFILFLLSFPFVVHFQSGTEELARSLHLLVYHKLTNVQTHKATNRAYKVTIRHSLPCLGLD